MTREEALELIYQEVGDWTDTDPAWVDQMVALLMEDPEYLSITSTYERPGPK